MTDPTAEPAGPDALGEQRADRLIWAMTAAAVVVFWLVSTLGRPWDLFDRAGFSADFYDEQARVFLRGRLAVDPAVPGPEGFLIDGATYLYYGPFLAVIRMPLMLFGDLFVGRLVRISMLIALVVLARWSNRLAHVARRTVRPSSTASWPRIAFVAAVLTSPALFAAGWITVYNETELWALTLAVVTITLTVEWAANGFTDRRRLLGAAAAALATTLTRAPIGFGVAFAIGVAGLVLLWRARSDAHRRPIALVAVAAGLVPVLAHVTLNFAKFGTLMSVPGDRQLLSLTNPVRAAFFERTGGSFFSPRFLPTTLPQYLRPDTIRFERLMPGIRYGPLAPDYADFPVETTTPASSLTASATLLLVIAIIGTVWLLRRRAQTWLLVVGATALGAIPTFLIGFIANRYLIDMLPPLIAAAAVGAWVLADLNWAGVIRGVVVVLAMWGLWVNTSLATWNIGYRTVGFTEARYALDDAVFGGGHDSLIRIDESTPVPRDGIVGVTADCSGVWIAEQGRWAPLDRPDGIRATSGTIDADQTLAAGIGWQLDVVDVASEPRAVFSTSAGVVFEQPVDLDDGGYAITVDAIEVFYYAQIGTTEFFLPGDVVSNDIDIRTDQSVPPARSALCAALID